MTEDPSQDIQHATIRSIVEQCAASTGRAEVLGLHGSAGAHLLARLLAEAARPLVVVAPDQKQATRLAQDLAFYHGRPGEIGQLPAWEMRPYDVLTPHPEVEATRLATLARLASGQLRAVVLPVQSLLQKLIPRQVLAQLSECFELDVEYPREQLLTRLGELGYQPVPLVEDRGTFSVRGDILDLFPPSGERPLRLEFFGDTLEKIRPFDPVSQRSLPESCSRVELQPARELVLAGEHLNCFLTRLKDRCDELGLPRSVRETVADEAREGLLAPGRSFLLPLNYARLDTLFDYVDDARWVLVDPPAVEQGADVFAGEVHDGEAAAARRGEPYVAAGSLYLTPEELEQQLSLRPRLEFSSLQVYRLEDDHPLFRVDAQGNGDLRADLQQPDGGLAKLAERFSSWRQGGWRILLVCHTRGQAERLADLLAPYGLDLPADPPPFSTLPDAGELQLVRGDLSSGFRLPLEKLVVVTEEELFGRRVRRRRSNEERARALLSSLAELKNGDLVVHADHGIGRYHGLEHLQLGPVEGDFLHLEYAGADKLFLPIDRIEKVQKYVGGEGGEPKLDKMGGQGWEKARLRARAMVEELARELLQIYARREMTGGYRYSPPDRLYREFEAAFPYEETPDQLAAIEDVLADMTGDKTMDRLVCGDVGYGKTEVAIRAAFKAVLDSRQVAMLVPTTVLAQQHLVSFRERLRDFPVTVEMVSRFVPPVRQKEILQRVAEGRVDILIGTHRLLQRDVRFKDLGLVVIDEEQRFGVTHKERLKKLRAEVDVLTLTATPIPRTLHLSMAGLRDLSIIETAPVDRLAIRTYVTRFDEELVSEAIRRELRRGGQVFFVHNRVQNIEPMADYLRNLVPEAKITVGHGQLGEKELEQVMIDFIEGRSNVLVCSTIIESGLDIPRANTIIINRADCFGLAQLYQLRGRVGRSKQRAYAYLLIPGEGALTRQARERLKVLQDLTELGAGFRIASHDLELRGAGDLLGARQAGQIAAVGFEMYTELLQETIAELQGREHRPQVDPEIRLGLSAYLPESYVSDPNQRLVLYRAMAGADAEEDLYALADELRDRYGEIPEPASLLLEVMRLRVLLKQLWIEQAEYDGRRLVCAFHAQTPVPPEKILALLRQPDRYQFSPDYRLTVHCGKIAGRELLEMARNELRRLL
ncbi:transcription-repair coupling factor [Geothermobacter hydrogeniphilus]|uniref:Transcription-repair-coupling factor n=1 Tax=Geothermobacter hydrogeniphilus TaxID=1969733 RepID=A0A1X0XZC8_9BACT|nr:transcription-repair coupling factor [Geothermobacter hydrogeniphilus]ORJ58280.1 transcription-repair coupling factor [Geothermobacter hydrogeniphilus]